MKKTNLILSMLCLGVVGATIPLTMTSCSSEQTTCDVYNEVATVVKEETLFKSLSNNSYWQKPTTNDNLLKTGDNPIKGLGWNNFINFLNENKPTKYKVYVKDDNGNFIEEITIPYITLYTK